MHAGVTNDRAVIAQFPVNFRDEGIDRAGILRCDDLQSDRRPRCRETYGQ